MKAFTIGKDCLFNVDNVNHVDHGMNALNTYIKVKQQQNDKTSFEDGMSFDEITEIASNRIANIIKEQLDTHVQREIGHLTL